jgi:hypothetical protein
VFLLKRLAKGLVKDFPPHYTELRSAVQAAIDAVGHLLRTLRRVKKSAEDGSAADAADVKVLEQYGLQPGDVTAEASLEDAVHRYEAAAFMDAMRRGVSPTNAYLEGLNQILASPLLREGADL